jgi:hypothetical protein
VEEVEPGCESSRGEAGLLLGWMVIIAVGEA